MKLRRKNKLLVEPPASATGDIAFNLIVFFLVCASVQPDNGRKQDLPNSETVEKEQQEQNIEVKILNTGAIFIDGDTVTLKQFPERIAAKLKRKATDSEEVVVVKADDLVEYEVWIFVTSKIEEAGGKITIQLEEEREVRVP
jgi:biopolymer transport protein ExbD